MLVNKNKSLFLGRCKPISTHYSKTMDKLKVLVVKFKNKIQSAEIPLFRGAVIHHMNKANILFHNHDGETFRYAYPLLQYKRIKNCAAIVCVDEGTAAIGEFLSTCNFNLSIGHREETFEIDDIYASQQIVQVWDTMFSYRLTNWLPLNAENYKKYMETSSLVERYKILEKILIGNLLSFAKGTHIHLDKEVICQLTQVSEPHIKTYKQVKLMSFNVSFNSNISLPHYVGIGKGSSLGYGVVFKQNNEN